MQLLCIVVMGVLQFLNRINMLAIMHRSGCNKGTSEINSENAPAAHRHAPAARRRTVTKPSFSVLIAVVFLSLWLSELCRWRGCALQRGDAQPPLMPPI